MAWCAKADLTRDVDAAGNTVPPSLAARRVFGPAVTCGRFARQFVSGKGHLRAVGFIA